MYDVSPDRTRFAIVTGGAGAERLVVALDVLGADHRPEGATVETAITRAPCARLDSPPE
jgi:hypothetical protein